MKTFIAIMLLACIACSKNNDPVKYTSVVGTWKFSGPVLSGVFDLALTNGNYYVVPGGYFTINSKRFPLTEKTQTTGNYPGPMMVSLQSKAANGQNYYIALYGTLCGKDFTQMTSTSYEYYDGKNLVDASALVTMGR